jgi:hypothetical protein
MPQRNLVVGLCVAGVGLALLVYVAARNRDLRVIGEEPAIEMLSVDQTVGVAFLNAPNLSLCRLGDPQAAVVVRRIIENPTLAAYHDSAACVLGYIGSAEDVPKLEKLIVNHSGQLDGTQKLLVARTFDALAIMARRDVDGAAGLLDAMMKHTYWEGLNLTWYGPAGRSQLTDSDVFVRLAVNGYAASGQPGLEQRVSEVLRQISDAQRRDAMQRLMTSQHLQSACEQIEEAERVPIQSDIRAWLEEVWNHDRGNPLPQTLPGLVQEPAVG